MLGKWIGSLSDEQRDRIIEGQGWCARTLERDGDRCLGGHAFDYVRRLGFRDRKYDPSPAVKAAFRFDALCRRFDMDRIVRACKARAARSNVITLTEPARVA